MQMISTAAMVASLITAVFSSTQVEAIAAAKKVDECRQEGGELIMLSQAPKERICVKGPLVKISAQPTPEGG